MAFKDIIGYEEEKKELINISNLLKNNEELIKYGGKLPKGLFILGPNGVGKTKLAEAFIDNANINTLTISINEIQGDDDYLFSNYLEEKFNEAKNNQPSIIFIDEIDKICSNNPFMMEINNKSLLLLNTINKYEDNNIFVLLVGNNDQELDASIKRSGRIDKTIRINYPTDNERMEILKYYTSKKPFNNQLDYQELLTSTSHFTGADIESICSNAINNSFLELRNEVIMEDLKKAIDEKVMIDKPKEIEYSQDDIKRLAIHEVGHALCSYYFNKTQLKSISILSYGNVKGYTSYHIIPNSLTTVDKVLNSTTISLGGYVANQIYYNKKEIGCSSDLCTAKRNIMTLVRKEGYAGIDKIIPHDEYENKQLISNELLKEIEKSEEYLLNQCINKANDIIKNNIELLEKISNELIIKKVLNKKDIDNLFANFKH